MEYQALPEIAQMPMLQEVMRMVLHAVMLFLALTLGCIASLCAGELTQRRSGRYRPQEPLEEKDAVVAAWRYSTR